MINRPTIEVGGIPITADMDEWYDLQERDLIETIHELADIAYELANALTRCRNYLGQSNLRKLAEDGFSDAMVNYLRTVKVVQNQ